MKSRIWLLILVLILSVTTSLSQDVRPSAYAILIDNTGSMRQQLQREVEIAKEVVKQTKSGSSFSLFGFATDSTSEKKGALIAAGIECTKDGAEVSKQIDGIFTVGGQTTLFDAIKTAAERLDTAKPSKCGEFGERNLVIISDGEDRNSTTKSADLFKALKQNGTKVFFVALIDELLAEGGFMSKSPKDRAKEFFQKLIKETGAKVVFPKQKQTAEEIVKELFTNEAKASK